MNILWLSWRDIKNPAAGGAEKVAIEVASRFARDRTKVTIFTARFKNSKAKEVISGVKIIRKGNQLTCRIYAFFHYIAFNKTYDVVIDEINTIPFFATLYAKHKTITLIHQLAKEYWFKQTFWPLSKIGYFLEPYYLKLYKNRPALALSNSTKIDLQNLGFKNIQVYRIGLNFKPALSSKKEDLILFIGRLTSAKKPQDAIIAFKKINTAFPGTELKIIGRGTAKFISSISKLIKKLDLEKSVALEGFVDEIKKQKLLIKAKIVLIPAIREGWNLVATEANAAGAIPIGYNVPGLKDSIKNGKNGFLVNTPDQMAKASIKILGNESQRVEIARLGVSLSKKYSWDNCYSDFSNFIFKNVSKAKHGNFLLWIISIAAVGFLIRLFFAILLPLDGFDETYDILVSQNSIPKMLQTISSVYPPAWHLILNSLEKFSKNYIFLRFSSVILGTFSIVAAAYLGKKIFSRKSGILTAIIFALTPTQIYYSSILRLYSFSILVSLLIFLSFVNFLGSNSKKSKLILLAALTVGNYTYYLFPILYICFLLCAFFDKNVRKTKLKSFLVILVFCALFTLPLFFNFLSAQKVSTNAFPSISILKIISIPLGYSFPLNLAQLTNLYPYFKFNFTNLSLLFFSTVSVTILLKALVVNSKKLILTIPLLAGPLLVLIFSYNIASVFGLRSLLIFSIPFYLLIAHALTSKKLASFYISLSAAVVVIIFVFLLQKPTSPLQLFIRDKIHPQDILIHTELTTFSYFSYLYPQFHHLAAIDSLWANSISKKTLNYIPVNTNELIGKNFWLLEIPSDIHKEKVIQFKKEVSKTHSQTYFENLGETLISRYEPK